MYHSVENDASSDIFRIIRTILYGIIVIIIITGNIFVLLILPRVRMQTTVAKLYLYSLTIADLCTGVFLGILLTITSGLGRWIFGDVMCAAGAFMRIFFNIAALLSLFAVTVDRFLAIAYPLRYPALMTRKKAIGILAFIWTTAVFFSFVYGPIIGRPPTYLPESGFCFFISENPDAIDYSIIICMTVFILSPFVITIALYSRIYCITRRHTKFASQFVAPVPGDNHLKRNMKFIKTFLLVILCFGIAWLPSVIIRFIQQLSDLPIPSPLFLLAEMLVISNSAVNVFIYYWRNKDFKKAAMQQMKYFVSYASMSSQDGNTSSASNRSSRSNGNAHVADQRSL